MTESRPERPQRSGRPDIGKMREGIEELLKIRLDIDLGTISDTPRLGSGPLLPPSIFTASSSPLRAAMMSPGLRLDYAAQEPVLQIPDPEVLGGRVREVLQNGFPEQVRERLGDINPAHVVESIGMVLVLRDNIPDASPQQHYFRLRDSLIAQGNALRTSGSRDPEEIARVEGIRDSLDAFMGRVEGEGIPHNAQFPF